MYVPECVSSRNLCVCLQSRKESMLTKIDAAAMDAETVQMLSIIDEEKDANVIINAEGLIQFANKGVAIVRLRTPLLLFVSFAHSCACSQHHTVPSCMP